MASKNAGPKSTPKPYFTDYTIAGMCERSAELRAAYAAERAAIDQRRIVRLCAGMDNAINSNQAQPRGGFPKRRVQAENHFSERGVPHHKFTDRYKMVDRITFELGEFVHKSKIYILHATRGWKLFA